MRSETLPIAPARRPQAALGWLWYLPVAALVWVASGWSLPATLVVYTPRAQGLVTIFLSIFFEAFPFVTAGVLLSATIGLFVSDARIQRLVPRGALGAALAGALLGLAIPVCECGTVPMARRMLHKGAPLPFGVAFLLAAPVVNPVVIVSTAVAFNGDLLILGGRLGLTLLIAVTVALALARLPRQELLAPQAAGHNDSCGCGHDHGRSPGAVLRHSAEELVEMGRWLIMGGLLAAAMQTFVPQSLLLGVGGGPLLSVLVLMALAVVLSVCSTVDAFLALALSTAFGPGALLAFLVFGPMIDIKSTLMFLTTLSPRAVAWILALVTPLVVAAGVAINLLVK